MDYIYENSRIRPAFSNSNYVKLTECYRTGELKAPKNNCDKITKDFIERLAVAEKIRQMIFYGKKVDLDLLRKNGLTETSTSDDYLKYLRECAFFEGDSFFSSKDRIKSLLRLIDDKDKDDTHSIFYLALYLMFDEVSNPKGKHKEIFDVDLDRNYPTAQDIDDLLGC